MKYLKQVGSENYTQQISSDFIDPKVDLTTNILKFKGLKEPLPECLRQLSQTSDNA